MTDQENQIQHESSGPESVVESVRALIDMMNAGGIGELNLKTEGFKIKLRSEAVALASNTPVMQMPQFSAMPAVYHDASALGAPAASSDAGSTPAAPAQPDGHVVSSPMIGTFYSASAPGEPAFVQIGDEVDSGQVIGIIEAMKIMNEITSDRSGVVVEILVQNAEAVEYGSPLIRIADSARLD
ncbi:MAG: acetyl-CoA carboxylase biotin carboxyl carrier protein [Thermomicrobiales bacterium]|nr:acetyl-CoA carboxylase biotin carboxyl carrier protein [Thermomicrobiales bacterium]